MLRTCHEWISMLAAESVHWSEVFYSHRQHVGNESCRGPTTARSPCHLVSARDRHRPSGGLWCRLTLPEMVADVIG